MTKSPQVCGLILCDWVRVETAPPSFNLDGLFLAREFPVFPTPPIALVVYASFFDGRGEGEMKLICTHLELERDIYYYGRWYAFPKLVPILHFIQPVKKLVFEHPGRHAMSLFFDSKPLSTRYFDIREIRR